MTTTDDRPSIAELQRMARTERCECVDRPGDRLCGSHLPPVLLEIAAAALAMQDQLRAFNRATAAWMQKRDEVGIARPGPELLAEEKKLDQCTDALGAALAKVCP